MAWLQKPRHCRQSCSSDIGSLTTIKAGGVNPASHSFVALGSIAALCLFVPLALVNCRLALCTWNDMAVNAAAASTKACTVLSHETDMRCS